MDSTCCKLAEMRKTKLIILPTKCLKTVGFLLLFLSCPVIGDWGRIRPESEMSQRSIQIEREGSCGLVRNPLGIENALTPFGSMECNAADAMQNNTVSRPVAAHFPESPIEDVPTRKAFARDRFAERRVSIARRERQERRAVSLDRRNERSSQRAYQERDTRIQHRRQDLSLDRRLDSRRVIDVESTRRLYQREREEERRVNERRENIQRQRLNSERRERSAEARRLSRESPIRRAAERRALKTEERRSVHEERMTRRMNRMIERTNERRLIERRSLDLEQDSRRRDDQEERRLNRERRSVEERRVRSSDDSDARRMERRSVMSNQRERQESEARLARRERQVIDIKFSRRRDDSKREVSERRSPERESERREVSLDARRRTDNSLSRNQEVRLIPRRTDKPEEEREIVKMMRGYREKSAGMERYNRLTRFDLKEKQFDEDRRNVFDNIKDWMGQSSWTANYGDLTTTCLVGAAVYLLTVRQVKSV